MSTPDNYAILTVPQSPGYLAGNSAITLMTPDLSAVDGYQALWAPNASVALAYQVTVSSTPPATCCSEGAALHTATSSMGFD